MTKREKQAEKKFMDKTMKEIGKRRKSIKAEARR